jgi:acetyl esterase/lipase
MRFVINVVFLGFSLLTLPASEPLLLWPEGAPGEKGNIGLERDMTKPSDSLYGGKRVTRISNVSSPALTVCQPPPTLKTGTAVLVCPGGGYEVLSMDLEGTEVCEWLNSLGVTAVLLKYRVPVRNGWERHTAPLQDVQRALGLLRFHAAKWQIDPKRIGIIGFSAGGHLSAAASTRFDQRTYQPVDAADQVSCRPDFAMLIYPAYLLRGEGPDLAPELTLKSDTPPTFLIQTEDDPIRVENALFYYLALKKANVPAEMHLFARGGHAYGLRPADKVVMAWPRLAENWMDSLDVLKKKSAVLTTRPASGN